MSHMKFIQKDPFQILLLCLLLMFIILGLWIRLIPMNFLISGDYPLVSMTDPWYTVHQVEQIILQFPEYPWFDPMISYPTGKIIDWGPLYPLFASIIAIIGGATDQSSIIRIISWIPVILGLLLVPLCYFLGTIIWDKKCGYVSSLLICVIGGETLFRSFYGYVDHHIMEVILSTLFFIFYFYILSGFRRTIPKTEAIVSYDDYRFLNMIPNELLLALLCGFFYYLGIMTMPTCTIIAGIVLVSTLSFPLFIRESSDFLRIVKINCIIFGLFICLYAITGIHVSGWSFGQYSMVHLLIPLGIIILSLIAYILLLQPIFNKIVFFYVFLSTILLVLIVSFNLLAPEISGSIIDTIKGTLGFGTSGVTIDEMQPTDPVVFVILFNLASIFAIAGFLLICSSCYHKKEPLLIAVLIWALTYLGLSMLVTRYFYYGGVLVVILAAIGISRLFQRLQKSEKGFGGNQSQIVQIKSVKNLKPIIAIGLIILIITILSIPVSIEAGNRETLAGSITYEWLEPLNWLKSYTQVSEIDYYGIFKKDGYIYPENTSTVLSWWVYGHWILALSQKPVISSPFETNTGEIAKYFLEESENDAESIADFYHGKYIITTNELLFDHFPTIYKWITPDSEIDPYYFPFYSPSKNSPRKLTPIFGFKPSFFNTTLVKLHVNDGSFTPSNGSVLISYQPTKIEGEELAIIKNMILVNRSQTEKILSDNTKNVEIISLKYDAPIHDTPSLSHYRLIYESNETRTFPGNVTLSNIKIFERVKGYIIPGTGTIEVPIVTNQGRHFTYRQQSVNGTFILPYATTNSPYDVHATAPYRIIETNKTFDVDESQIVKYYT